jgi:hypothetical protein
MSGGGEERVEEQPAGIEYPVMQGFTMGTVIVRVEDAQGVRDVVCQPETASESAGADATGNGEA